MTIAELTSDHVDRLVDLFRRLPDSDVTFIKEEIHDPEAVRGWLGQRGERWVAEEGDSVIGYAALLPLSGWSDHVADLRLVVDPSRRGHGVGRALILHAVGWALHHDIRKVVVEVAADQEATIELFGRLGFTGEALLRDHFRDRSGELRDLVMLAFFPDTTFGAMDVIGLSEAMEAGGV
jgi:ribosomal protein S18 acetylase RimI-like enzyme